MREGLILLDEHGSILSINAAAQTLFGADAQCVGRDFLTIERSHEISAAIQAAVTDGHSEVRAERAGRVYQFDISRITSDGKLLGTVILAFDITEQEFAERNRREFTANVSHELKTPLQGIIGSAELIENGMVKPDDLPRFVGHIHAEAARLVTLIDDIIRLSQLDEGDAMPTEPVDLLAVSQEAAENLHDAAAARDVTVSVTGQPSVIPGVCRLLYEVVYNLCDNAIKYNRDGGRVDITVAHDADGSSVTVADTGIGIAPEHQSRVFERFYRVDKSHSRRPAARASDCRSSSTPCSITTAASSSRARPAWARPSASCSRMRKSIHERKRTSVSGSPLFSVPQGLTPEQGGAIMQVRLNISNQPAFQGGISMYQITLGIDGMMCGMCESHINDAVRNAFPVRKVTSSHSRGQTVILSETEIPEAELRPVIAKTGYELTGYACAPYEKKGLFHRH